MPPSKNRPSTIVPGPDGALWFVATEVTVIGNTTRSGGADKIGRITTVGAITEYPIPTSKSIPNGIAAGPDGALWFTESYVNKIGRLK